jgi:hypothetical protein
MEAMDLVPSRAARAGLERLERCEPIARTAPALADEPAREPLVIEVVARNAAEEPAMVGEGPAMGNGAVGAQGAIDRAADLARRARLLNMRSADPGGRGPDAHRPGSGVPHRGVSLVAAGVTRESLLEPKGGEGVDIGGPLEFANGRGVESATPTFGVEAYPGGARIVQPLGVGSRLAVAGEFNGWSATSHVFRRDEASGAWVIDLNLPAGRHAYRLVIDGQWVADAFNPLTQSNPFGESNSVIDVPAGL